MNVRESTGWQSAATWVGTLLTTASALREPLLDKTTFLGRAKTKQVIEAVFIKRAVDKCVNAACSLAQRFSLAHAAVLPFLRFGLCLECMRVRTALIVLLRLEKTGCQLSAGLYLLTLAIGTTICTC